MQEIQRQLEWAKEAAPKVGALGEQALNRALAAMARALVENSDKILAANATDMKNAAGNIADVMLDRLRLDEGRIKAMADGMMELVALKSPLGLVESETVNRNGLNIRKVRVPLGVVGVIYESRPNVTADVAALCLKSGNACVLRGGSEAIHSNLAIAGVMKQALEGFHPGLGRAIQILEDTSHAGAARLMTARGYIDLLIPRGGKGLISAVVEGARGVPVIETGTGICHVYVDKVASLDMAVSILYNAKTSRPSVCNSAEVCLVHRDIAQAFLPAMARALGEKQVELRLDSEAAAIIPGKAAQPQDFDTEFLDYILAVKVVGSLQEAIEHINRHSTHHSEAIVTADDAAAEAFCTGVDSAAVYVNASTRFTDGGVFGLGCEIGISTQKVGARGPMGLYELTSYKYVVHGTGQVRA